MNYGNKKVSSPLIVLVVVVVCFGVSSVYLLLDAIMMDNGGFNIMTIDERKALSNK